METTLGTKVRAFAIFDKDYRSAEECDAIKKECQIFCDNVMIHCRKEIENFLLVPEALDRAASRRISERSKRTGRIGNYSSSSADILTEFAIERKSYVVAQVLEARRLFERSRSSTQHAAVTTEAALVEFEDIWKLSAGRLRCIPGKEAITAFVRHLQERYDVNVTGTSIVEAMNLSEVPDEVKEMIDLLSSFACLPAQG